MKHIRKTTRTKPVPADMCITLPVTPDGLRQAEFKEALGWEPQATDALGVIVLCK